MEFKLRLGSRFAHALFTLNNARTPTNTTNDRRDQDTLQSPAHNLITARIAAPNLLTRYARQLVAHSTQAFQGPDLAPLGAMPAPNGPLKAPPTSSKPNISGPLQMRRGYGGYGGYGQYYPPSPPRYFEEDGQIYEAVDAYNYQDLAQQAAQHRAAQQQTLRAPTPQPSVHESESESEPEVEEDNTGGVSTNELASNYPAGYTQQSASNGAGVSTNELASNYAGVSTQQLASNLTTHQPTQPNARTPDTVDHLIAAQMQQCGQPEIQYEQPAYQQPVYAQQNVGYPQDAYYPPVQHAYGDHHPVQLNYADYGYQQGYGYQDPGYQQDYGNLQQNYGYQQGQGQSYVSNNTATRYGRANTAQSINEGYVGHHPQYYQHRADDESSVGSNDTQQAHRRNQVDRLARQR